MVEAREREDKEPCTRAERKSRALPGPAPQAHTRRFGGDAEEMASLPLSPDANAAPDYGY